MDEWMKVDCFKLNAVDDEPLKMFILTLERTAF